MALRIGYNLQEKQIVVALKRTLCYNCNGQKQITESLLRVVEGIGPMKPGNRYVGTLVRDLRGMMGSAVKWC